ncbi:MAG: DUF1467 family protein [Rhizobiales bacterium]|nr:DUF1467 family protein [Hyphomicrobiales bacterium]
MSLINSLAIFFIIWWVVLFAVLPWGVRTQAEDDEIVPGSAPSAPSRPHMLRKVIATTIVTAIIFTLFYMSRVNGWISLDSFPFMPTRNF